MVLELISLLFWSTFDLLRGTLINSFYAFIFVIVGFFLRRFIAKRFAHDWFRSSILTTYLLVFLLIFLMHLLILFPVLSYDVFVPQEFRPSIAEAAAPFLTQIFNIAAAAFVLTFLLMPLELIGLYVYESAFGGRKINTAIRLFVAVFACTLIASILAIFVFPYVFGIDVLLAVLNLAVFGVSSLF